MGQGWRWQILRSESLSRCLSFRMKLRFSENRGAWRQHRRSAKTGDLQRIMPRLGNQMVFAEISGSQRELWDCPKPYASARDVRESGGCDAQRPGAQRCLRAGILTTKKAGVSINFVVDLYFSQKDDSELWISKISTTRQNMVSNTPLERCTTFSIFDTMT